MWERQVMKYLDEQPHVIYWASEEIQIPYISPVDKAVHRYFPDFVVKIKLPNGDIRTMIWEIKPHKQTKEPRKRERITRKYITEVLTYNVNQAKWAAAKEFAEKNGMQFMVITEKELFATK